jgi:hypothetical protein
MGALSGMNKLSYMINRAGFYYWGRTAVVFGERRFTFAEVNLRSNQLARGLMNALVAVTIIGRTSLKDYIKRLQPPAAIVSKRRLQNYPSLDR